MLPVVLGASLDELVHGVGGGGHASQPSSRLVGSGPGEGKMFRLWAGAQWWLQQLESPGRGRGSSRGTFLARGFREEQQLCVSSCWALGKPFFLSEPPVSFSANGGANFYCGKVVRIK